MLKSQLKHSLFLSALLGVAHPGSSGAQVVETVGSRALGMGGAFVAVASDSTATWWNPAGLAAGPFLDLSLAHAVTEDRGDLPAHRDTARWFAFGTPPVGFSYYRLRLTDIRPFASPIEGAVNSTVTESGSRQIETAVGADLAVRSLAVSQLGITLVQTLIPGFHAGVTLKYVRGTVRTGREDRLLAAGALLDRGDELEGGDGDRAFGADVGLMGVGGALRAGLLVRNAVESELENDAERTAMRLERQFRVGLAYDAARIGGPPLIVAVDADVSTIAAASGDRRNVAIGAERWLWSERVGVRGGARFNTTGAQERAGTGGVSVVVRPGLFVDAHVVAGGRDDERGWGVAARVSF